MFLLLIQFCCLCYRDSEGVDWDNYLNMEAAVQKRNVASNHIVAKQRWAKDRNLGPAHSLAGSPPKSSSPKLPNFYRESRHSQRSNFETQRNLILSMPVSACCGYRHTSHLHTVGVGTIWGSSFSIQLSVTCNADWLCRSSPYVQAKSVKLSTHSVVSPDFLRRRTHYPQSKKKHQLEWKHAKETCRWRGGEERKETNWAGWQLVFGKAEGMSSVGFFSPFAQLSILLYYSASPSQRPLECQQKMNGQSSTGDNLIKQSVKHNNELICYTHKT